MSALLEVRDLRKHFPVAGGGRLPFGLGRARAVVRAVDGVDLEVARGECLALVGESGSGKTTLARCALRLIEPTAGRVRFSGRNLLTMKPRELSSWRRHFQMVFQDPYQSLDPRLRVGRCLEEPLRVHRLGNRQERRQRVAELLELVDLPADAAQRYPHEFSGGQRQRIAIARALATEPDLLVADEPVSALDVSVRAQVVNLLAQLQDRLGLALLLIAHDLSLVAHVAHRVAVLYLGEIVEEAPVERLFREPQHPYTVSLLAAVPRLEGGRGGGGAVPPLAGEPPSPTVPLSGCSFHPRCPIARPRCADDPPPLEATGDGRHRVACHYAGEMAHPIGGETERGALGVSENPRIDDPSGTNRRHDP